MIQLNQGEVFPIVRQLNHSGDTNTYYVRATIRNSKKDIVLATFDLADQGNQRFLYNWQVLADPTGLGLFIDVTINVYTDSGYTTVSETYPVTCDSYLIQERIVHAGGGGSGVNYDTIRNIVRKEIEKIPKPEPIKFPKQQKVDDIGIKKLISKTIKAVESIELPEQKETDLSEVMANLNLISESVSSTHDSVRNIDIPEVDLNPVMSTQEKIIAFLKQHENNLEDIIKKLGPLAESSLADEIKSSHETLSQFIGGMAKRAGEASGIINKKEPKIDHRKFY